MAPVPSTPTAVEANAERHIILKEITFLTQQRDRLRNEVGLYERAHSAVKREIGAHAHVSGDVWLYDIKISEQLEQQRVELLADIQALEDRKRSLELTTGRLAKVLPGQRVEQGALQADIDEKTAKLASLGVSIEKTTAENMDAVVSQNGVLEGLDKKIADATKRLALIEETEETKTAWIIEEEERLATKSTDLAIYERRIRAMAEAVGMDPNHIIL